MRALADVLQRRGVSVGDLLPEGDAWLALDEYASLFSRAVERASEPALGLLCGAAAIEPSFDVLGALVAHTRTLRQGIEAAQQFHPLVIEGAALQLHVHNGYVQLRCEFPRVDPILDRGLAELGAAGLWRMLRAFAVPETAIRSVAFEHSPPSYHAAYTQTFAGRERFDQGYTGVELVAAALDRPNPHYQPELLQVLQGQAERHLARLSRPLTFVERVEAALRRQPTGSMPDMRPVARELGMSARSLRRRLDEEGTSFRNIAHVVMETSARSLLQHPAATVQEVSHALGFGHVTTFHRAFKRWTGLTPQQYRDRCVTSTV